MSVKKMPWRVSYILSYSASVGRRPEDGVKQLVLDQLRGMSVAVKKLRVNSWFL